MRRIFCILSVMAFTSLAADDPSPKGPVFSTAAIIEVYSGAVFQGLVFIQREDEPYIYALPNREIQFGIDLEETIQQESLEETHLELKELSQFRTYSKILRDSGEHLVEVVFLAKTTENPMPGGKAAFARVFGVDHIPWNYLASGHAEILRDYLKGRSVIDPFRTVFRPPF